MHTTVCDYLLEIVHNAIDAEATQVTVNLSTGNGTIQVKICDNGKGMTQEQTAQACNPFFTTASKHPSRQVGLGIPFLRQAAETLGGTFSIQSSLGKGTTVAFTFQEDNVDTPPLGSIAELITELIAYSPNTQLTLHRQTRRGGYQLATSDLIPSSADACTIQNLSRAKAILHTHEEAIR